MPVDPPWVDLDEVRYVRGDSNPPIKGYTLPIVAKGVCEARRILRRFILTSPGPPPAAESKLARHWLRADGPVSTENVKMQNRRPLRYLPPRPSAPHLRTGIRPQDGEISE